MLTWLRRVRRDIDRADRELVRRSAALPPTVADPVLAGLSRTANRSALWFTIAALIATRAGLSRRAALRGVLAIAGASATANALAKPLFPRRRPAYDDLPPRRRIAQADRPDSSSFPSGHAASAAAFATAAMLESRAIGSALVPLAGAVAYSRVHTGVHWPSDVAAGALLGTGVALATRRWWTVRPAAAARAHDPVDVPALDGGDGLTVLVNPGAGGGDECPADAVVARWPAATVVLPEDGQPFGQRLRAQLRAAGPLALGVAGGDGTVATVAAIAAGERMPLVVLPYGTLNHFARDVGVPDVGTATRAVAAGSAVAVDLGTVTVDGASPRWFVNTASLGGYPDVVRLRERCRADGASGRRRRGHWPGCCANRSRCPCGSTASRGRSGCCSSATGSTARAASSPRPGSGWTPACSTSATCAPTGSCPAPGSCWAR